MRWDINNPTHREIMDTGARAWRRRMEAELDGRVDAILAPLPAWLRLLLRGWWVANKTWRKLQWGWVRMVRRARRS